ncbi:uncharacterized protein LOC122851260 [Aphidius gifuensis]|uniref:uncharacterized protein LOC122851260 n=1 Tax=Aphidius gifuensis TaxID=684658 RepID=UPI001CDB9436|nr:uncharacterized protein LOC122851260 [Aphidius gifuensis]
MSKGKKKSNITRMIQLPNEKIKPIKDQDTFTTSYKVAIWVSVYNIITTLLLPFTVRGRVGGQYGVVVHPEKQSDTGELVYYELLNLTDMSVGLEVFLIGLLFLANLLGFISVIKKSLTGLELYMFYTLGELIVCLHWLVSVSHDDIKSHVMSQFVLRWYCSFALVIDFVCSTAVIVLFVKVRRNGRIRKKVVKCSQ